MDAVINLEINMKYYNEDGSEREPTIREELNERGFDDMLDDVSECLEKGLSLGEWLYTIFCFLAVIFGVPFLLFILIQLPFIIL